MEKQSIFQSGPYFQKLFPVIARKQFFQLIQGKNISGLVVGSQRLHFIDRILGSPIVVNDFPAGKRPFYEGIRLFLA